MTLFTFNDEQHVKQWHTENDVVMGGVSDSQVTYAAEAAGQKGVARFAGSVSLENNGGFAQIIYPDIFCTVVADIFYCCQSSTFCFVSIE